MKKVVFADRDYEFIAPLEAKILSDYGEIIELEVITEPEYFAEFFSQPKNIDILFASEEFYFGSSEINSNIQKQNIDDVFVITERDVVPDTDDLSIKRIYRYKPIQLQYSTITAPLGNIATNKETRVILVYSAAGGVGKSTIALGISSCLAQTGKKILFIDAEQLGSSQYYFSDKSGVPNTAFPEFSKDEPNLFSRVRHIVRNEVFDYVPAFGIALSSLNLNFSIFKSLISSAKELNEYDAIVVDTNHIFDSDKAQLLALADKVIMVVGQSESSVFAIDMLTRTMSFGDGSKYYFVCNKFSQDNNAMATSTKFSINDYVDVIEGLDKTSIEELGNDNQISNIAVSVL